MLPSINTDVLSMSLLDFAPELLLCGSIVLLLFLRLFKMFGRDHMGPIALLLTLIVLGVAIVQWGGWTGEAFLKPPEKKTVEVFFGGDEGGESVQNNPGMTGSPGMLLYDTFTVYMRVFLYSFAALIIWLSLLTGIPDREDSADFYCLLLGATLGMVLMAMSCHLLMVFIAIEMASLPSYALAGFLKGKRQSSEAALKYVVYGGGASGIMLYGISLLVGKFGTGYLPEVLAAMVQCIRPAESAAAAGMAIDPVLILGTLFILIGIAFKLSLVPFHFWCPDVFEGASAEVAGFLSVASKGAALALLARITMMMGGFDPLTGPAIMDAAAGARAPAWSAMIGYLVPALAFFAALTATFGNLAAYRQTNLKRLLAYSTIAHAGYMLMGLCTLSRAGVEAMVFYLAAYLFMNLGAFAVVAFLRNETGSEDLRDFRGLIRRSPVMVVTLSLFLLSLLGIPPLVGFAAKFQIFQVLYTDGEAFYNAGKTGLGATLMGLLVVAGLNTVLSAFYYLKVMKVMILDHRAEDLEGAAAPPLREPILASSYSVLLALAVLGLGILWGPVDRLSGQTVERFRKEAGKDLKGGFAASRQPKLGGLPAPPLPPGGRKGGGPKDKAK
jgi:NADH-quinone oxidoreductase subunit N